MAGDHSHNQDKSPRNTLWKSSSISAVKTVPGASNGIFLFSSKIKPRITISFYKANVIKPTAGSEEDTIHGQMSQHSKKYPNTPCPMMP